VVDFNRFKRKIKRGGSGGWHQNLKSYTSKGLPHRVINFPLTQTVSSLSGHQYNIPENVLSELIEYFGLDNTNFNIPSEANKMPDHPLFGLLALQRAYKVQIGIEIILGFDHFGLGYHDHDPLSPRDEFDYEITFLPIAYTFREYVSYKTYSGSHRTDEPEFVKFYRAGIYVESQGTLKMTKNHFYMESNLLSGIHFRITDCSVAQFGFYEQ
jgi:hypothetical protein